MEFVAKKGDMLFVGEDEDTLVVTVLNTIKFEDDNYLHVIAIPMMVEKIFDEENDSEFVREVVEGEKYDLEPVEDARVLEALKAEAAKLNVKKEREQ